MDNLRTHPCPSQEGNKTHPCPSREGNKTHPCPSQEGNKTRVYIAGKVSELPYDVAYQLFEKAEIYLIRQGYEVVNPMKVVPKHSAWDLAMKICLRELVGCEEIYVLNNFKSSTGAIIEMFVANVINLKFIYQD